METKSLIEFWFKEWQDGDFLSLPITDDFTHTSPFGVIDGKEAYLKLVSDNRDKFLGYKFLIHDGIYEQNRACVRYTGIQGDFKLDVSEWYYTKGELIESIIAHYHIGEIRDDRKLS